jgi:hypothetical protein
MIVVRGIHMSVFSCCIRCGNQEDGVGIYLCQDCGCISCTECDKEYSLCPDCDSSNWKKIGCIDSDADND